MKVKEKTQTSVRVGCMDGVTASLDTTFVLEVNIVAIQKPTKQLIKPHKSRQFNNIFPIVFKHFFSCNLFTS